MHYLWRSPWKKTVSEKSMSTAYIPFTSLRHFFPTWRRKEIKLQINFSSDAFFHKKVTANTSVRG